MKKINKNKSNIKADSVKKIPLLDLQREYRELEPEIEEALLGAASDARYILGPAIGQLEEKISAYLGTKYCRGVASGTDALVLSLRALAIQTTGKEYFSGRDEIITTPFTFTATGGSILRSGATPVFVDIDPNTYNIDPQRVAEAITSKTVGIIPVHLYGLPCPMDEIMELAANHNLFVIEDVAQAFGAEYKGKKAGSIGDFGAFSFFPSKNLGAFGDGGMVSTNDENLNRLVAMLSKHGGADKYNVDYIGYNSRLDTLQAAILLVKFKHVDRLNNLRCQIAQTYSDQLQNLPGLELPLANDPGHVYHQYTIRIKDGRRDEVQHKLSQNGIVTAVYYPVPLHKMKVFNQRCRISGELTNSEKASLEVLSLPVEPLLAAEEIQTVTDAVSGAFS